MTASTHRLPESKSAQVLSAQALFDLIYTGAKEKDAAKIKTALLNASINIRNGVHDTPAHQSALECTPSPPNEDKPPKKEPVVVFGNGYEPPQSVTANDWAKWNVR